MKHLIIVVLLLNSMVILGQVQRNIMSSKYSEEYLKKVLTDPAKWYPELRFKILSDKPENKIELKFNGFVTN